jgi:tetratricopeptide (TPR) repeat protein
MVACWRGVTRVLDGSWGQAAIFDQHGGTFAAVEKDSATWTAPAPSPSYDLVTKFEKQQKGPKIPEQLMSEMHEMRDRLIEQEQAKKKRHEAEQRPCSGAEPPPDSHRAPEVIVTEKAAGKRSPECGDSVRIGYSVVLAEEDAPIMDMCPDFEYVMGGGPRGTGQLTADALERMLAQLRRGQVASMQCTLGDLFTPDSPQVKEHGAERRAVCEARLFEIYQTRDCSFQKGAGKVFKEVVKEGVGAWCDTPTDEGTALLRVEEVTTDDGTRLYPLGGDVPIEQWVVPGNGQVCDALECAILEMKQHETALVTCSDPAFFADGQPELEVAPGGGATYRVTLLDYTKGPDVWSFPEEERLKFAERRKAMANALFKKGRFRLAHERYRRIEELFHHLDRPKGSTVSPVRDRFLGKPELAQSCKELRSACRLNMAACCLRFGDPAGAKQACDTVLLAEPENHKALYRRAQAFVRQQDFVQACRDLERLLDIDGTLEEARTLYNKVQTAREASDKQQRRNFRYGAMFDGIQDPRSIKWDYTDAAMDAPGIEAAPISSHYAPKKVRAIKA